MKNRKQQTPAQRRARPAAAKRSAARPQAAARRGKAAPRDKPARRSKPARHGNAARRVPAESRMPDDGALTLAAECTVAEADALKAELARRVAISEPVTLDVSALQRIDTAGLQLLAAFVRDRRTAGRAVEWRGRASALEAAAGLLGLHDMLELAGEVGR